MRHNLLICTVILISSTSTASVQRPPQVGDAYEITLIRTSSQQGSDGSSGSTDDKDAIVERVTGVSADGLELEYDLPQGSAEDRARVWQFPARIFRAPNGATRLLNGPELETRLDGWLKAAKWSRAMCGRWIFTWNAFHIECDPQSVIKEVEAFDLRADELSEGVSYRTADASAPGTISREASSPDGSTFVVEMPVDPDAFRHARAEADVVEGEILNRPIAIERALEKRAKETVSGTIAITFETDASGVAYRRTKLTKLTVTEPDGRSDIEAKTEILERRLVSQSR
jgi:hypothetical protein